jgi:diguanylate cyclase (GGDEF)-like protein
MSTVTLKRYSDGQEPEKAVRSAISLLLDAATEHAVQADAEEYESFRQDIALLNPLDSSAGGLEQLLFNVGALAQAIVDYNARTTRTIGKQATELRNMIAMLTQAVVEIAGSSSQSKEALESIKVNLEGAAVEDIQSVGHKLRGCLEFVCEESSRQKTAADSLVHDLKQEISCAQARAARIPEVDRATGLPLRAAAESAFVEALATKQKHYVLTLVMDRLQSINARFGGDVGDQVLKALRTHVEASLMDKEDRLFRWVGPAMILLMPRQQDINQVRSTARRAIERVAQREFDVGGRTVLIPLSVAWSVIALIGPPENAPKFIERFVAGQMPRDYV